MHFLWHTVAQILHRKASRSQIWLEIKNTFSFHRITNNALYSFYSIQYMYECFKDKRLVENFIDVIC